MESEAFLREQLLALLTNGNAHMDFDEAVANFPEDAMNRRAPNVSYTPWHLLEHLRRTQNDILEFIRDPKYVSPPWPEAYWPKPDQLTDRTGWLETIRCFQEDREALAGMVRDTSVDLTAPIPHAPGYNVLREILLAADHNAYHIGEFGILRQVMQTWPPNR